MGWGCEGDKEIKGNRHLTEGPSRGPAQGISPGRSAAQASTGRWPDLLSCGAVPDLLGSRTGSLESRSPQQRPCLVMLHGRPVRRDRGGELNLG